MTAHTHRDDDAIGETIGAMAHPAWEMDERDLDIGRDWRRSRNPTTSRARQSRAEGRQSGHMTVLHRPTGVSVEGWVAEGSYSRKEMQREMETLQQRLVAELQQRVAAHLRIPGR